MIKLKEQVERTANAVPCTCGGYADLVDSTPEEIAAQRCGRSYACCARAFVCRLCGERLVGAAEAPDFD